ncbi:hypothetical protein Tco_1128227 [Tanacetum coccineum]
MPLSTYLNLGLGELAHTKLTVELADTAVKYPKGIAKNVLVGLWRNFGLLLIDQLDPLNEDYIELNDLNEPFDLMRNQGDDLMPNIEEGEDLNLRTPTCIHIIVCLCDCPKKFHNSIMKDKMVYKGNNVIGDLTNVPIFVGTFSVVTDFTVLEDMDAYRDEGMGDVIFGEPFLREVGIKTRRFEGMITIYNGNNEVTYPNGLQFTSELKHHTNESMQQDPDHYEGMWKRIDDWISHLTKA